MWLAYDIYKWLAKKESCQSWVPRANMADSQGTAIEMNGNANG